MTPQISHSASKRTLANGKKSTGFKIGKFSHSKISETYRGKAEQIKKTLIHKAKLKKQRAKELVRAGYSADGPSASRRNAPASGKDFNDKDLNNMDCSMDVDLPPIQESKLGPRKDGMRIDNDDDTSSSRPRFLKRPYNPSRQNSESDPVMQNGTSPKKPKLDHPQPAASSSSGPTTSSNLSTGTRSSRDKSHSKPRLHHANGQPKLSVKLTRMLNKIQREP
ncbi:hypothetical protein CROQUDRAFT_716336 [Cronartium quercuum f. sp. fusiforme G11]|uniref:Uncharacterized protein n=1 Tax=Cronartium quercuum f. sp. fusiforme G11 TaxID=708437 RepID=A0A9P6TAT9_9BASI|nr:hypothetical protein CROQUDRAFT_716336 [Cronartium quercuum f. sp. fusiforme G11]